MTVHIEDDFMTLEVDGAIVATARFSQYAAADGNGVDRLRSPCPAVHPQRSDQGPDPRRTARCRLRRRSLICEELEGGTVPVTDRLIRITTALAVVAVAAIISHLHAYELVTSHGRTGITAHLLPFTVDGLIWAASMVVPDASRRHHPVPSLAKWSLAVGIVAGIGPNLAHGLNHGLIGTLVSAWPALALVGSFELLMLLIRTHQRASSDGADDTTLSRSAPSTTTLNQRSRRWNARCEDGMPKASVSER